MTRRGIKLLPTPAERVARLLCAVVAMQLIIIAGLLSALLVLVARAAP